jgi:hypothetical protein
MLQKVRTDSSSHHDVFGKLLTPAVVFGDPDYLFVLERIRLFQGTSQYTALSVVS